MATATSEDPMMMRAWTAKRPRLAVKAKGERRSRICKEKESNSSNKLKETRFDLLPKLAPLVRLVKVRPVSITSVISPVNNWKEKYDKKMASQCRKISCRICGKHDDKCTAVHPEDIRCPPCSHQCVTKVVFVGFGDSERTWKAGPLQFSMATNMAETRMHHKIIIPATFMLDGKQCDIFTGIALGSLDVNNPDCVHTLITRWTYAVHKFAVWAFQNYGFGDAAIGEVFSRAYEDMFDQIQLSKEDPETGLDFAYEELEEVPAEELSIANKVVLVAVWDGRVKVAGQLGVELVIVGDYKLKSEKSLDVMCYGQPHTQVTVREGEVRGEAVFIMVPKGVDRDTLSVIAERHLDDVEMMAEAALEQAMEGVELAWVMKIDIGKAFRPINSARIK